MTLDEVDANIARLQRIIVATKNALANARGIEAYHELENLRVYEQSLSLLQQHRAYLISKK
jgi:hypothetical protein